MLVLPVLALMLSQTSAQQTVKIFSCDVTKFTGALYKKDNLLGENRFIEADSFEQCVGRCLQRGNCKGVNFVPSQQLCGLHASGLSSLSDKSNYDRIPEAVHGAVNCPPPKASGPVGCGKQAAQYSPIIRKFTRIIGGTEAKPHTWPWLVHLNIDLRNGFGAGCGASLLRVKEGVEQSDILLTAAHCVTEEKSMATNPRGFAGDQVTAIAGEHDVNRYDAGEQSQVGAEIRFHPNFRFTPRTGANNDIALIKLAKPFIFTDTIRPICLPTAGEAIPVGKTCVAAGWGRNNSRTDQTPEKLQQLVAPAHDVATCRKGWGQTYLEDQMICAGPLSGTGGTCQGDSGGMLACQQTDGSWRVYGATSFGIAGSCLAAGKPGNFARVSSYLDWVNKNMKEMTSIK